MTDTQVVNLYRIFLDRVPEAPALAAWSGALESGRITVGQMTERILRSPEHTGRAVTGAYEAYLGRTPESVGLASHAGAIQRGVSPERVDAAILGSQEYFGLQGSDNTAFVQGLYLDVLGREADSAGLEAHVGRLARGASRTEVAYAFLTAGERGRQVAGDAYREALGREGTEAELAGWAGVLSRSAGGSTAVWASVAGSPEANRSLSSPSLVHNPVLATNGFLRASLPNLVHTSDTGASNSDNVSFARTPELTGSVDGSVSQVQLYIDGRVADLVPVVSGVWNYKVPAQKALGAGIHTFRVQPLDSSGGKAGLFSHLLRVTTVTAPPTATTVGLAPQSDSGAQGDGMTTEAAPTLRGSASPGLLVNVSIDGVVAGRVKADTRTGVWEFKSPRLANGVHDIAAVAENNAGLQSSARSFELTVNGERTVVLDGTDGNTVELTASHLLGRNSQGFIVTQVERGTLQRWSAAKNDWVTIPNAGLATDASSLQNAPAICRIGYDEVVRWTPSSGDLGVGPAFAIVPSDTAGGLTAPTPDVGTVPGKVVDAQVGPLAGGLGQTIIWKDPTDGCGCGSTRYSIEVTREDGQTLVYNVPRTVHGIPLVEGGAVLQARVWGATKAGAGEARSYDAIDRAQSASRFAYTITSGASFFDLGTRARSQLASSPTGTRFTTSLPLGGSHADLAYLEVNALPDATEAAQGLPAGTPMIVSSESNALSPKQLADLKANPIYASHLFPGTVNGDVQPDQVRAHFQAGETLQFSGTVDRSVRAGATIVLEEAQNLGDGSLGPWLEKGRIAVGADGSYSQNYVVPYGLNSVRMRLEYPTKQIPGATATSSTSAPISTPIDLSGSFNAFGITTAPWQAPNNQGFDRNGNYYNSDYTGSGTSDPIAGTPITYNGITFPIGPIPTEDGQVGGSGTHPDRNPPNFVQAKGQTIQVSVDADKSDYLYLAGAASNGNQISQKIMLNFTDGTTETWTQSFHDWASVGPPQSDATTTPANPKLSVKVAVTTPDFPTPTGPLTIDGVAISAGDRVLFQNLQNPTLNGIYTLRQSPDGTYPDGAWARARDAATGTELLGAYTTVTSGTYAGKTFVNTNTGSIDVGVTAITFAEGTPPVPAPRPFAGELLLKTEPERINQLGNLVTTPAHIFAYCRNLHGKQLASITLPNNDNIGILSAVVAKAPVIAIDEGIASAVLGSTNLTGVDLVALTIKNESNIGAGGGPLTFFFADQPEKGSTTTPPTYTTKQVTVPMGQQTTIAYIAPDSSSQMTFYVQKGDDTCVGPNCSTYLTDWSDGSGGSSLWASNISPSLNSQIKAGQHWTMTIQNAGLGYNGYLDSPSGQGLPLGTTGTPPGAQFKLMTQTEINTQPHWAVVTEKIVGEIVGIAIVSVLTFGAADEYYAAEFALQALADGEEGTVTVTSTVTNTVENVAGAEVVETVVMDPVEIPTIEGWYTETIDDYGNRIVTRQDYGWTFRELTGGHGRFFIRII